MIPEIVLAGRGCDVSFGMLTMNQKRAWVIGMVTSAVVVGAFIMGWMVFRWREAEEPVLDAIRIPNALAEYVRDLHHQGKPVPPAVRLEELIQGGYLQEEEVRVFKGAKVTFYRDADETRPQGILMTVEDASGSMHVLLADGSLQQLTPQRLKLTLRNFGLGGDEGTEEGAVTSNHLEPVP